MPIFWKTSHKAGNGEERIFSFKQFPKKWIQIEFLEPFLKSSGLQRERERREIESSAGKGDFF